MTNFKSAKDEYDFILNQLSDPELISDWKKFEELSKRKNELEKIIKKEEEIKDPERKINENKEILKVNEDPDLSILAENEIQYLQERKKMLEKKLELESISKNSPTFKAIIMEIRAGAGGEEASLFAGDLLRMYSKYAENQGWEKNIMDSNPSEVGGFKEVIFELKGDDVYEKMKYEAGVHRVQRIPQTEKGGRIHTSTASVAVLPKPQKTQFAIRTDELRIEVCKSTGPGGQNVNKRETAVKIIHIPTGLTVFSRTERNQSQNKENALNILSARLMEMKSKEEVKKISGERKNQIGRADRSEKIRTYNFPQDRVTDHRIKKSFHNIQEIMEGKLNPIIKALTTNEE